jgi:hypothetical protein
MYTLSGVGTNALQFSYVSVKSGQLLSAIVESLE